MDVSPLLEKLLVPSKAIPGLVFGFRVCKSFSVGPLLEKLLVPPKAIPGLLFGFRVSDSFMLELRVWGD